MDGCPKLGDFHINDILGSSFINALEQIDKGETGWGFGSISLVAALIKPDGEMLC